MRVLLSIFLCLFSSRVFAQAVCVDLNVAKLRKEPSLTSKSLVELPRYSPLKLTGKKDSKFLEATAQNGKTGWIRASEVSSKYTCISVSVEKSRLRSGPGEEFPKDIVASRGEAFLDLGGEDGWTKVERANGSTAWIRLEHTWKPRSKLRLSFDEK